MSENQNLEDVVESAEPVPVEEPAEQPEVPAQQTQAAPVNSIPYDRFQEVIAQREQERLRAEQLEALVMQQQAQLQQIMRPQQPQRQIWEQYEDPNARALAQLVDQVVGAKLGGVEAKLQGLSRFEMVAEKMEADTFWGTQPTVPAEVKEATERYWAQIKTVQGTDRSHALKLAKADYYDEVIAQQAQQANVSAQAQAQVNRTARAVVAPAAPTMRPPTTTQPVTSSKDLLRQIEAEKGLVPR